MVAYNLMMIFFLESYSKYANLIWALIFLQTLQVAVLDFVFDESKILNLIKANDWTRENCDSTTQNFWPRASAQGPKSLYVVKLVLSNNVYFLLLGPWFSEAHVK